MGAVAAASGVERLVARDPASHGRHAGLRPERSPDSVAKRVAERRRVARVDLRDGTRTRQLEGTGPGRGPSR